MASSDEISDVAGDWSIEGFELIPIEEEHASFGRYVLCYEIASGGMGTVYLAREQGPGGFTRPVAIKRIHPHLARKRQFVEMFLDEAQVAARVIHPNVCSVYGFGDVAGTHYIAMEYLVGQPLSEVAPRVARRKELATSPRWHALAARVVTDACEGLHAAHELRDERGEPLNVVHRDVSTHNVFATYDGAVKVLDFGIARARGRRHETRTGTVKGKFAYMSPEQARASKSIDRRSDVWSLGVVLWELLALRRLFGRRSEVELLRAVGEEPIVPPSLVRPEVPQELDAIVMRALERDVDKRYPSARALARDLGGYVSKSGEGTSLADLAELLGDLFAREREGKLVALAAIVHTDTADRVVSDPKPPPPPPRALPPPPPRIAPSDDAATHLVATPLVATPLVATPRDERALTSTTTEPHEPRDAPAPSAQHGGGFEPPEALEEQRDTPETPAPPAALLEPLHAHGERPVEPHRARDPRDAPETTARGGPERAERQSARDRRWRWALWVAAAAFAIVGALAAVAIVPRAREGSSHAASRPVPARGDDPAAAPASAVSRSSEDAVAPAAPVTPDPSPPIAPSAGAGADGDSSAPVDAPEAPVQAPQGDAPASTSDDEREAPDPRPQMGRVNVAASGGWADIYVRGRFVARTPHVLRLPAGQHVIELRPNGTGPPRRVGVEVRPGAATRVVVPLAPRATTNPY